MNSHDDKREKEVAKDLNLDPITGAPGAHPVGTGVAELERSYVSDRGQSKIEWTQARPATRAAWDRADKATVASSHGSVK